MAERFSRRSWLARAGLVVAGAMGLERWLPEQASGGPAGVATGQISCVLAPEQTEGPFYVDDALVRRNITEGKAGTPLRLRARVLDVSSCKPIKGAIVDVWHCDAGGVYSGVQGNTRNFLRGVQRTDVKGWAVFDTVYPGWYPGRAVHIHVKVHVGGNVVHTGQLYFSDKVSDAVFRRKPYARRGARSTRNSDDAIFRNGGRRSLLTLKRTAKGYTGTIALGVQRG